MRTTTYREKQRQAEKAINKQKEEREKETKKKRERVKQI